MTETEKDAGLNWANGIIEQMVAKLAEKDTRIDEYRKEIIEKDEEIRVLEAKVDIRVRALDDFQVDLEMWRE